MSSHENLPCFTAVCALGTGMGVTHPQQVALFVDAPPGIPPQLPGSRARASFAALGADEARLLQSPPMRRGVGIMSPYYRGLWLNNLLAICFLANCQAGDVKYHTLCEIVSTPGGGSNDSVLLRAVLLSEGRHGHVLRDVDCESVRVYVAYVHPLHSTVAELDRLLVGESLPPKLKVFTVQLLGRFKPIASSDEYPLGASRPAGDFLVEQVISARRIQGDWRRIAKELQ
jgi:hypothetical protein